VTRNLFAIFDALDRVVCAGWHGQGPRALQGRRSLRGAQTGTPALFLAGLAIIYGVAGTSSTRSTWYHYASVGLNEQASLFSRKRKKHGQPALQRHAMFAIMTKVEYIIRVP
jgi:hypothetical protein